MNNDPGQRVRVRRQAQRRSLSLLARLFHSAESGEDSSFEFSSVILPMVLMVLLVAFATVVRAAQMPIWTAASECARAAVASETESNGRQLATNAAYESLYGNAIDPTSVQVTITGDWTPDTLITCHVTYNIDMSRLAFFAELTGGSVRMDAEVSLRTEPFKSKWQ
ncbi:MAG: hypothetical protein M1434_12150 [Chloroflexi bacterium]|nr:hypothetical protein [Chloroflexota bacterium]MCL5275474.1 hypothetical protein [Chloroflexota bacterium]